MKINDRIVGGLMAAGLMAALVGGATVVATATPSEPAAVVETEAPFDYGTDNGLMAEQEAEAAAAEAKRIADEAAAAEAARVAAEAAAAEAQRIADEAAAYEAESFDEGEPEPTYDEPVVPAEPPVVTDWDPATKPCAILEDGTPVPCE